MITADIFIDTVQNGKRQFISKYVTDKDLAKTLNDFVDAQTVFSHAVVTSVKESFGHLNKKITQSKIEEVINPFNIDWVQAGIKAWLDQPATKTKPYKE
jgi:DNA-binding NarL/FixJ family response regulator